PSTPVTLSIAYCDQHPVEDLMKGFTTMYPNVTFDSQYEDCNSFSTDLVNKLTSANPPDITEYVDAAIQTVAPKGAVIDLAPYVQAYGWDKKFPASELAQLQLSQDGKVHGQGIQYGIPGGASFVGVFYNKSLLAKAGITAIPQTLDEFEADLATAKAAGITPIALGSQDDGGIHLWGSLTNSLLGAQAAQDWVNGKPGSDINQPATVEAAQKLVDWNQAGYFTDSPNGTSENDARANFAKGSALFTVDGSWSMGTVPGGDEFGFFPFPVVKTGDPVTGQGFTAGFAISSKSDNADVAAAFLDYLASAEAAEISVGLGMLPVNIATAPDPEPGLATDIRNGYAAAAADNGIVTFYDHATPTMHTTLTQGIQGVIAGQSTPADFVKSLQDDWTWNQG
ncbi:MAG: extracellular solute-binding protein, partial [Propionibacteriaceae bacterium]|nr:extracellular solute-binding protein [Propionibacteriaceae bacterium]